MLQKEVRQFEPIGDEAQWRSLYKVVKDSEIDRIFTWTDLQSITGLDVRKRREVIYIANKELLKNDRKMLTSIRNEGYRVCTPKEQLSHAANRKTRGCRQFKKGVLEIRGLNAALMSQEEKVRAAHLLNHLQITIGTVYKKNTDALEKTKVAVIAQEEAVNRLDEMMNELIILKQELK